MLVSSVVYMTMGRRGSKVGSLSDRPQQTMFILNSLGTIITPAKSTLGVSFENDRTPLRTNPQR